MDATELVSRLTATMQEMMTYARTASRALEDKIRADLDTLAADFGEERDSAADVPATNAMVPFGSSEPPAPVTVDPPQESYP